MVKRLTMLMGGAILGTSMTFAQNVNVSGVVYAEDGEPVVGASVKVDGTKMGTVTNIDGKFELAIPADKKKITVSYLGMSPKTVTAGKNMKITLNDDTRSLKEVMVVAYGTVKKSAFTGSATEVSADKLKTPSASLDKGLDRKSVV